MKKVKAFLILILIFIGTYFLQMNFFSEINIRGIKPNLFIIFVVFTGLFAGKKLGVITGILIGLILDCTIGKSIGFTSMFLGIIGFMAEYFDENFSKDSKLMLLIIIIISTIIYETGIYIINVIKFDLEIELLSFIKILLVETIFNSFMIIIFYSLFKTTGYYIEENIKGKKILTRYF